VGRAPGESRVERLREAGPVAGWRAGPPSWCACGCRPRATWRCKCRSV